jgi:hypothetical protein
MNNFHFKYQEAIKDQFKKHLKSEEYTSLADLLLSVYDKVYDSINAIADLSGWPPIDDATFRDYFEIVRKEAQSNHVTTIQDPSLLSKNKETWLTEKRKDKIKWNYTNRFLSKLHGSGRAESVVNEIEKSSLKILEKLGDPNSEKAFFIKGLVDGDVQSGKTGNFNAVINRAVDSGYRLIIVLSGLMDDLRSQTQRRIDEDVVGEGKVRGGNRIEFGSDVGSDVQQIISITSEDADFNRVLAEADFSLKQINIMVCKKNVSILKNILIWIDDNLPEYSEKHNLPLLIIDDEADNASLNNEGHKGEMYASAINRQIRALLGLFHKKSYLGYTATPFANVIQDRNSAPEGKWGMTYKVKKENVEKHFELVDNLFPDDFIVLLDSPTNYIGAHRVFETLKESPKLPIVFSIADYIPFFPSRVREINDGVVGVERFDSKAEWDSKVGKFKSHENFISFTEYKKNTRAAKSGDVFPSSIPESLKDAVICFILGVAVRESRQPKMVLSKVYQPHNTMLIHVSRFTTWQTTTQKLVKVYYDEILDRLKMDSPSHSGSIYRKFEQVWRNYFAHIVGSINSFLPPGYNDEYMQPIVFDSLVPDLTDSAKGIEILALNSKTDESLTYDNEKPSKVIAIGGNKLSRGFTLEGLIISYFVRTTNYSDSLLQMGRWFGYRPGYLDCCKLFTSQDLVDKYDSTTLCIEELKAEFLKMEDKGDAPRDFELKVRKHPGVLKITRPSILKNTRDVKWSYQDSLVMSTTINVSPEKITHVWQDFKNHISPLFEGGVKKGSLFVKHVGFESILKILSLNNNFEETKCQLMKSYIEKCNEKSKPLLSDWTLAIKVTGQSNESEGLGILYPEDTGIDEEITLAVRRGPNPGDRFFSEFINESVFKATSKSANIMTSPADMKIAIDPSSGLHKEAELTFYREKALQEIQKKPKLSMSEALDQVKSKVKPERIYREKMAPHQGVLIIYLFDPYYAFRQEKGLEIEEYTKLLLSKNQVLKEPLVALALGFPPIPRKDDPCGEYVKGDYEFETILNDDEPEELDSDSSVIPDDSEE